MLFQAIEDFSDRYDEIFKPDANEGTDNEEGHVLRSFTDDPEIPLRQIMVQSVCVCVCLWPRLNILP